MKTILFTSVLATHLLCFTPRLSNYYPKVETRFDTIHSIGEHYEVGIIFSLTDDGKHGLIVAIPNQKQLLAWSNGKNKLTGTAEENRTNKGADNSIKIFNIFSGDNPNGKFAAKACLDFSVKVGEKVYDDWYLPSKQELDILFLNREKVGDFEERYYWTSNEVSVDEAWIQNFYDGRQLNVEKSDENYVIPIRAF